MTYPTLFALAVALSLLSVSFGFVMGAWWHSLPHDTGDDA